MKKLLILAASALLLAACGGTADEASTIAEESSETGTSETVGTEESSDTTEESSSEASDESSSEAPDDSSSDEEPEESSSDEEPEESSSDEEPEESTSEDPAESESVVVSFAEIAESGGYGYSDHPDLFAAYFSEVSDLIPADNITIIERVNATSDGTKVHLTLGSSSGTGSFSLVTTQAISAIEVTGTDYHNSYSYGGNSYTNRDNSGIDINGTSQEFTHYTGSDIQDDETLRFEFEEAVTEITISSISVSRYRAFVTTLEFFLA